MSAFDLPVSNKRWLVKSKDGKYMAYDHSLFTEHIEIAALFIYPHKARELLCNGDKIQRVEVVIKECD